MMFCKRQNYEDTKKGSDFQGREREGGVGGAQRTFRSMKILSTIP